LKVNNIPVLEEEKKKTLKILIKFGPLAWEFSKNNYELLNEYFSVLIFHTPKPPFI